MKLNNKGFTLVELLAVIVIVGLVLVTSTYVVTNAINNSKETGNKLNEKNIFEAARIYTIECSSDTIDCDSKWIEKEEIEYFCVSIDELKNKGLLKEDVTVSDENKDNIIVKRNKNNSVIKEVKFDDENLCINNE